MEFSPKPNKSKIYCSVYGCKSRACKNDTVRFFNEKIDRFNAWIKILKMRKTVTATMRVCSLHFVAEDFIPSSKC